MLTDQRAAPFVALNRATVEALFTPITGRTTLGEVAPVDGGLVNTLYRVTTATGAVYALRVYADGDGRPSAEERFRREREVLARIAQFVPVPHVAVADDSRTVVRAPYLIYRWVDGITLNDCRRRHSASALMALAEPLGRLLATIAAIGVDDQAFTGTVRRLPGIAESLADADARLASSLARDRLGPKAADALRAALTANRPRLIELEAHSGLVHGDFGGRNVIVRSPDDVSWDVTSVIDWESAAIASAFWDVGSLFRYHTRYSPEFLASFARGYSAAGGTLPDEWCRLARLIDVTQLVQVLSEDRDLPWVFEECRAIVGSLIQP